jgi:hypothetical protein
MWWQREKFLLQQSGAEVAALWPPSVCQDKPGGSCELKGIHADKGVPKLMLPEGSVGASPGVQPLRHNLFCAVQHVLNQQRILRLDQGER